LAGKIKIKILLEKRREKMEMTPQRPSGMELSSFRREMDKLWDRFLEFTPFRDRFAGEWSPSVDISETENELVIKAQLPGLDAKDINVDLSGDLLTIKGEKKKEEEEKSEHHYYKERFFGSFQRSFKIPVSVQTENVEANFDKGVLEVKFSKTEEAKKKEIKINLK
jgi:HSP20 family protein